MPNIDRLAAESVSFTNAVSSHPMCAPYRASLFTGKYSSSTGMVINELRMNPRHHAWGHVLNEGGYQSYYIGKWHLWANELGNHDATKNAFIPRSDYRLGFDGYWAGYNFHHVYYGAYYFEDKPERIAAPGYEPDAQTDLAIAKLKEAAALDGPFSFFLSYGTPHDPWDVENVPAEYYDLFRDVEFPLPDNYHPENDPYGDDWAKLSPAEREQLGDWMRVYYAMTANLDWNVGRLLQAVDELGLHDDTIFVFTSDHGEMFGAQGRRAKNIFYDQSARIPLLVRYPGVLPPNQTADVPLGTPDIMPTLLSLMGLPIPAEVEGSDLSRCLSGSPCAEVEAAFMQGMGATAIWEDGHEWRALRGRRYTYAVYRVDGAELLFDNQRDPGQTKNVIDVPEYAPVRDRYHELLRTTMDRLGDTFESCTWYRDHWTDDRLILRTATLTD